MSMEPILSLKNVCSYYDKVQVLYDINVDVYPGEIVSVSAQTARASPR